MGKTRKLNAREKFAVREKGKRKASLPLRSFLPLFFSVFALSHFNGSDYLGAWNRLDGHIVLALGVAVLDSELTVTMICAS